MIDDIRERALALLRDDISIGGERWRRERDALLADAERAEATPPRIPEWTTQPPVCHCGHTRTQHGVGGCTIDACVCHAYGATEQPPAAPLPECDYDALHTETQLKDHEKRLAALEEQVRDVARASQEDRRDMDAIERRLAGTGEVPPYISKEDDMWADGVDECLRWLLAQERARREAT